MGALYPKSWVQTLKLLTIIEIPCVVCLVAQTLCNPMNCSLPGPLSVGIFQARTLEWAYPSSRRSSQPKDQTQVSHIAGRFFIIWAIREAQEYWSGWPISSPRDLPNPRIKIKSCIAGRFFTSWATREAQRRLFCLQGFSRQDTGSGLPHPPPGNLPNPGIEPRCPALQVDSLPFEPSGKSKNIGVGIFLPQGNFPT